MNLQEKLLQSPGLYKNGRLKKSYSFISNRFRIPEEEIRKAVRDLRKGNFRAYVEDKRETPIDLTIKMSSFNSATISTPGVYLVTGCLHAPFHNKAMYNSIFNYIEKETRLSGVIIAGDLLDMHSLSRHDKGKVPIQGVTLDWEYNETGKFLDEIASVRGCRNIDKYYIFGNHEDRYFRALSDIDTSKYGNALLSPTQGLNLEKRGYTVIEDWKSGHINMGRHLEINHGEFFNVHTAKKTIDTYRKSVMYFHTHRFQIYTEGLVGGWNMGWGGDINSKVFNYASRAMKKSWLNAAALVVLDSLGDYYVQPLLFINNKLIVNGKQY